MPDTEARKMAEIPDSVVEKACNATIWSRSAPSWKPSKKAMRAALEAALPDAIASALAQRWRPIEEAPRDGTPVLTINPESECGPLIAAWQRSPEDEREFTWCVIWNGDEIGLQPTHYMPLPSPPADTGKE